MISIVIPLYNKEHTIQRTLGSVLAQTYQDFEIVIVNDGSTDNGSTAITEYTKDERVRIIDQPNQGVSVARNQGVLHAKNNYIAFLDGDDEWLPTYLECMYQAILKYPNAGMICSAGKVRSGGHEHIRLAKKYDGLITEIDFFHNPHVFLHTSATVVSKKAFNLTQGFPVGMKRNQDFALFFSLALITQVVYCGFPLSIYVGDVEGQATAKPFNEVMSHVINRYNLVYSTWESKAASNKSFIIFMKYELRHTFLSMIKNKDYTTLTNFMEGLENGIEKKFSTWEWSMFKKQSFKILAIFFIYATKIRWRMRDYPIVQS